MPHFVGIDMSDMATGQGEWTNMQDVIRRSFRTVFDHIGQQQTEIGQLKEVSLNQSVLSAVCGVCAVGIVMLVLVSMLVLVLGLLRNAKQN